MFRILKIIKVTPLDRKSVSECKNRLPSKKIRRDELQPLRIVINNRLTELYEEVNNLQEKANGNNILFLIRGLILTIVTVLLFYPGFGGTLMVLNGVFIYFSYFLAAMLLAIYAIIHVAVIITNRNRITDDDSLQYQKEEFVLFSYAAIMIMIGLLQGRYILNPILGVALILLEFIPLYELVLHPEKGRKYFTRSMTTIIKEMLFFVTAILLLIGNQPFEQWNIPLAESLLLLVILLNIFNMWTVLMKKN